MFFQGRLSAESPGGTGRRSLRKIIARSKRCSAAKEASCRRLWFFSYWLWRPRICSGAFAVPFPAEAAGAAVPARRRAGARDARRAAAPGLSNPSARRRTKAPRKDADIGVLRPRIHDPRRTTFFCRGMRMRLFPFSESVLCSEKKEFFHGYADPPADRCRA